MKAAAPRAKEDRGGRAILLFILAFFLFTGIDVSAKWLIQAGLAIPVVVFCRYAIHILITIGVAATGGGVHFLTVRRPWLTFARGAVLGAGTSCNFISLEYLPLTVTVSIFFTVPLLTTALAALILKEKVGPRRWTAIGVGFIGVLIITQPWSASFHWAMFFSLFAVLMTSFYALLTRRLAGEESPDTMQFWAAALPCLLLLPFAMAQWSAPTGAVEWGFLALMGFCGWAGHQAWGESLRYAEASAVAPFQYIQIIFMAAASWLIFHEPPTLATLIGAIVVIASGLYVWLRERRLAAPPPAPDAADIALRLPPRAAPAADAATLSLAEAAITPAIAFANLRPELAFLGPGALSAHCAADPVLGALDRDDLELASRAARNTVTKLGADRAVALAATALNPGERARAFGLALRIAFAHGGPRKSEERALVAIGAGLDLAPDALLRAVERAGAEISADRP